MSNTVEKTSLLIPSQLPEFIRDESAYEKFVLFLQSYYEWMEQNGKVTDRTKNLLNYKDIDKTTDEFLDYFYNEFLAYFPKDILADKRKVAKLARELYKAKGTESSYKFLFKTLYNSDVEFFYTTDSVLKTSSGKWYVAKSLRLLSLDPNLLKINNLRLFGETTKSIAVVETSKISGSKTEVFVSNVERLFQSGEFVRVVDANNQDVLFDGQPLRAKVVGQISGINVEPKNRGLFYRSGDPVVFYGGLVDNFSHGATATIKDITKGSLQRILVNNEGYGYRDTLDTYINITGAPGAIAVATGFNTTEGNRANVNFITTNSIQNKRFVTIGDASNLNPYGFSANTAANYNAKLKDAFDFISFSTYPISAVTVENGGGGITQAPSISAQSTYLVDNGTHADIARLGILAPIQITSGGQDYQINDPVLIVGGTGYGAVAKVTGTTVTGSITRVEYVDSNLYLPLGGLGYSEYQLPSVEVHSTNPNAVGASLYIPGILGRGATFTSAVDRVGAITSFNITDPGEDYISVPSVSVKVQDLVVTDITLDNTPKRGDVIYQGNTFNTAIYTAYVDSIENLYADVNPANEIHKLRVYNYNVKPNPNLVLKIKPEADKPEVAPISLSKDLILNDDRFDADTSSLSYGDGSAKAKSTFLGGLIVSGGVYLDETGQPSSSSVLQSSEYNNFTYEITLEKEIEKYRKMLLEFLHPTGTKVIGRHALKDDDTTNYALQTALSEGRSLSFYTGTNSTVGEILSDFYTVSNNVVSITNLAGSDMNDFVKLNDRIEIVMRTGEMFTSQVAGILPNFKNTFSLPTNDLTNGDDIIDLQSTNGVLDLLRVADDVNIVLRDHIWTTLSNVAYVTANSGSNVINISSVTNAYDIVNNGEYTDPNYPLKDIVYVGDKVLIANNTYRTVNQIDYQNGLIYVDSNFTHSSNSLMTVNKTLISQRINFFGVIGQPYLPELTDQLGNSLVTQNGKLLILG